MEKQRSIAVGMSGGVDSAVSAALLLEQGFDVVGITCDFHPWDKQTAKVHDDAQWVCNALGIPHYHVDCEVAFTEGIVNAFVQDYAQGLTPSPCVLCNRLVKFPSLIEAANDCGCEFIATGHYASVFKTAHGGYGIRKGKDAAKDQSYMLAYVPREILSRLILPLENLTKDEVRAIAAKRNLPVASKQDSQDICFAPNGYRALLVEHGQHNKPGDFVNLEGEIIGCHTGLSYYTIGQRKGIGIAAPEPLYVLEKQAKNNRVVVGKKADTALAGVVVKDTIWQVFDTDPDSIDAEVKLRYRSAQAPCHIARLGGARYQVVLENAQEITAPGQFAVFYNGDMVLGAGIIESIMRKTHP